MRKRILFGLIIFLLINMVFVVSALEPKVYVLDIKYDNGMITKENIKVIPGEPPDRRNQPEEGYSLELVSFNGEILHSFKFNFPLQTFGIPSPDWFDEQGNQIYFPTPEEAGIINLNETTLNLVFPYFPDGKSINIYSSEEQLLLEISVSQFSSQAIAKIKENGEILPKIQTYFKEDKTGRIIKYILYAILSFMLLVMIYVIYTKIIDKYRLMKVQKENT